VVQLDKVEYPKIATAGVCPHCRQLDTVRKVSAIVAEGVSVGHYQSTAPVQWQGKTYYLPVQRETTSSTLLAQRLAPPQPKKPRYSARWDYASTSFKVKDFLITVSGFVFAILSPAVVMLLFGQEELVNSYVIFIVFGAGISWYLLLVLMGRIIPPLGRVLLDVWGIGPSEVVKQAKATGSAEIFRLQALAERKYEEALRQYEMWPKAMQRWNELYYCARCDGVFLEGSRLVPVEQMYSFLYE